MLFTILWLLFIAVICFQFWQIRETSEYIERYLQRYCDELGLQLLSIARIRTRPGWQRGKLAWKIVYHFEFSSQGDDSYTGVISTIGKHVEKTELPPYRI